MSKQSEAKKDQSYTAKPWWPVCANCEHFRSEIVLAPWMVRDNEVMRSPGRNPRYTVEEHGSAGNMHCSLGGFRVGKSATCLKHSPKVSA